LSLDKIEPLLSILGHNHMVSSIFEFDFNNAPYVDVIVDNKNLFIVSQGSIAP
jgi:hypothetical protein